MNNLEQKIYNIIGDPNIMESQISSIVEFIDKCSLSEFETLKNLDYDLSQDNEYSFCECYKNKGCDIDEEGGLYCIYCKKSISST